MRDVILVDENGKEAGVMPLEDAHRGNGTLHRAFSALLFTLDKQKVLLQQRTPEKLFGGLWTNSCCSHPFPGEDTVEAGERRVKEELGVICNLKAIGDFTYQAVDTVKKGFSENEHDTVLIGTIDEGVTLTPDPNEITYVRWISITDLQNDLKKQPQKYAPWFPQVLSLALES